MWVSLPLYARFIEGDAASVMHDLPTGSVDLVATSPPFLGLRSYTDDPRELGKDGPGTYVDGLLAMVSEARWVLAPHGSLIIELGDTFSGSGGAGGDMYPGGMREGRFKPFRQSKEGEWPTAKSLCAVPSLIAVALAYGKHPLTGVPHAAGKWLLRNHGAWVRPNPRPGFEGDRFRASWSSVLMFAKEPDRYWHEPAARQDSRTGRTHPRMYAVKKEGAAIPDVFELAASVPKTGGHQAVWPDSLVSRFVETQCPLVVCEECGQPSRYITEEDSWSDCHHEAWRRGMVLDPYCGSGTTLAVATGSGRNAIGIDLDGGNYERVLDRVGPMFLEQHPTLERSQTTLTKWGELAEIEPREDYL